MGRYILSIRKPDRAFHLNGIEREIIKDEEYGRNRH